MSYAQGTKVESFRSRIEIERLLAKYRCSRIGVMHEPQHATVYFERECWSVQMRIPLPTVADAPTRRAHRTVTLAQKDQWVEQTTRERWRQLLLVLKAKFTALEHGVETFEQTFLAHLVIGGVHLGDRLLPVVRDAQKNGGPLLLGPGSTP